MTGCKTRIDEQTASRQYKSLCQGCIDSDFLLRSQLYLTSNKVWSLDIHNPSSLYIFDVGWRDFLNNIQKILKGPQTFELTNLCKKIYVITHYVKLYPRSVYNTQNGGEVWRMLHSDIHSVTETEKRWVPDTAVQHFIFTDQTCSLISVRQKGKQTLHFVHLKLKSKWTTWLLYISYNWKYAISSERTRTLTRSISFAKSLNGWLCVTCFQVWIHTIQQEAGDTRGHDHT